MHKQLDACFQQQGIDSLNTMGNTTLEAAYKFGELWLEELLNVLEQHKQFVIDSLEAETNGLKVIRSEGLIYYGLTTSLEMTNQELNRFMIDKAKVGLNSGIAYGEEGSQFMRMNIACPRSILEEGVKRIINAVKNR